jgi:hypothetical protein
MSLCFSTKRALYEHHPRSWNLTFWRLKRHRNEPFYSTSIPFLACEPGYQLLEAFSGYVVAVGKVGFMRDRRNGSVCTK